MGAMRFAIAAGARIGLALAGVAAVGGVLGGCATARTSCPLGTERARRIYSGGAEAEYCHRPDGVRQGPETRYYESGAEHVAGEYVDGAQSGVWRFRFNNGRNWRAERWDDGALVGKTVDPAVARLSPEQLEALGPTSSDIIKLTTRDARAVREARARRRYVLGEQGERAAACRRRLRRRGAARGRVAFLERGREAGARGRVPG